MTPPQPARSRKRVCWNVQAVSLVKVVHRVSDASQAESGLSNVICRLGALDLLSDDVQATPCLCHQIEPSRNFIMLWHYVEL